MELPERIRWYLLILVTSGFSGLGIAALPTNCDPVPLLRVTAKDGKLVNVEIDEARARKLPSWKPTDGDPPVSVGRAIAAVEEWVKRNAPQDAPIWIGRVEMQRVRCESLKDTWFYIVEYSKLAQGDAQQVMQRRELGAVLMDGAVVSAPIAQAPRPPPKTLVIDRSLPGNTREYDGPEAGRVMAALAYDMLRAGKFEQLDAELSSWLDTRERLLDGQFAYPITMYALGKTIRNVGRWEASLADIKRWQSQSPTSRHAPIVEALYWHNYAWYARGTGFSNSVSRKGWELFRERIAQSRRALESGKGYAEKNPLWHTVMINVAWDQSRPRAEVESLFAEAVKSDPGFYPHYFAMAQRLTPRWGGGIEEFGTFVEKAVNGTAATDGATMYARLYWTYADVENSQSFRELGIPWSKMKSGFEDLISRYPSPWNINNYASFACRANDKGTFLKLLPKLTPRDLRPDAWSTGYNLDNCKETFTVRT